MRVRRCAVLWLEPKETARFELENLLAGGTGVASAMQWLAHAPQLDAPMAIEAADVELLGTLSPSDWVDAVPLRERFGARLRNLMKAGLVIGRGKVWEPQRLVDERFRQQHWFGPAALLHADSRWGGLDAAREVAEEGMDTAEGMRSRYGAPPSELHARADAAQRLPLPAPDASPLEELLDRRSTCRNFDASASLPKAALAAVLARTFGARGNVHAADDFEVLKKTSPSGGALHPTEAYLIVQRVEGVAPGLYHYHAGDHALEALPSPDDLAAFARLAVAGQYWFSNAPVLVVLAPRFVRNFWKYRNHAKAYRVVILDVGHLSQTLYLAATELGLGAFITAAINETDIERAFGMTNCVDGPLAVCGFGARAETMATSEFDPNKKVWPRNSD